MSQTYVAAIIAVISGVLPFFGFEVNDSVALGNLVMNFVTIIAGIWALVRRVQVGDINALGIRRK